MSIEKADPPPFTRAERLRAWALVTALAVWVVPHDSLPAPVGRWLMSAEELRSERLRELAATIDGEEFVIRHIAAAHLRERAECQADRITAGPGFEPESCTVAAAAEKAHAAMRRESAEAIAAARHELAALGQP